MILVRETLKRFDNFLEWKRPLEMKVGDLVRV